MIGGFGSAGPISSVDYLTPATRSQSNSFLRQFDKSKTTSIINSCSSTHPPNSGIFLCADHLNKPSLGKITESKNQNDLYQVSSPPNSARIAVICHGGLFGIVSFWSYRLINKSNKCPQFYFQVNLECGCPPGWSRVLGGLYRILSYDLHFRSLLAYSLWMGPPSPPLTHTHPHPNPWILL